MERLTQPLYDYPPAAIMPSIVRNCLNSLWLTNLQGVDGFLYNLFIRGSAGEEYWCIQTWDDDCYDLGFEAPFDGYACMLFTPGIDDQWEYEIISESILMSYLAIGIDAKIKLNGWSVDDALKLAQKYRIPWPQKKSVVTRLADYLAKKRQ